MSLEILPPLFFNRRKISSDLIKAFFWALGFHFVFLIMFKITTHHVEEQIQLLPFTTVEIDLGEKPSFLIAFPKECNLIFPEESPESTLLTLNLDRAYEEKWIKKESTFSIPDFSSLEILPYTLLDAL